MKLNQIMYSILSGLVAFIFYSMVSHGQEMKQINHMQDLQLQALQHDAKYRDIRIELLENKIKGK